MKDESAKEMAEENGQVYVDPHHCTVSDDQELDKRWKACLKAMRNGEEQLTERADLIKVFFNKLQHWVIRLTKGMKWFDSPLKLIPPCEVLKVDIPYAQTSRMVPSFSVIYPAQMS